MGNLRYKWLKMLGYNAYAVTKVSNYWGSDFIGYSTELKMQRGTSFKVTEFKNVSAERLHKMLLKGQL